ncbi:S41 family peptidase [Maribacter polysiphoniae]|uniref:Peptidase S41-like protein n=1 Tax=Maribacter polysiphoniae TaxID=429344 RepID=A0A316E2B1_9FLAO|nr:S41 family peptidase [Maribacter polysiphoniae]MBD1261529.1 S41 family peptidase [Maribacter polysiphoniae]PWK22863.1 peptidase S41-like protein [Maribacter polysiphoniae]
MSLPKLNHKVIFQIVLIISYICLTGCTNNDDTPTGTVDFWYTPQKGYVLERSAENIKLYGVSSSGCTLIDDDLIPENYAGIQFNSNGDQLIGSSNLLAGDIIFDKLIDDSDFCDFDVLVPSNDPQVNFQYFWDIFNDYYAFFELRNVNWQDNLALSSMVTSTNLYEVLESMTTPLKDGHVSIVNEVVNINSNRTNLLEIMNSNLSSSDAIETTAELFLVLGQRISFINSNYLNGQFNTDSNGNMIWGLINNEVGYFNVVTMEDYAAVDQEIATVSNLMDQVMEDVQQANIDQLIIDLRFNTGGHDGIALEIASRFITNPNPVFTKKSKNRTGFTDGQTITLAPKGDFQFSGGIVLLTSPVTASAAEIFVMCLKDLPNVTIVGQNTNGVFSEILTHRLPNGTFIGLSNQIYADNSGNVFEGIGIGPIQENRIPFLSTNDFNNSTDSGIERSLDIFE